MTVKDRVFVIVSQVLNLPLEAVSETSSPQNIEAWDSLMHMSLILALEEEFQFQFSDEQILNIAQVADFLTILSTDRN
jgi:acyl carrier protein